MPVRTHRTLWLHLTLARFALAAAYGLCNLPIQMPEIIQTGRLLVSQMVVAVTPDRLFQPCLTTPSSTSPKPSVCRCRRRCVARPETVLTQLRKILNWLLNWAAVPTQRQPRIPACTCSSCRQASKQRHQG